MKWIQENLWIPTAFEIEEIIYRRRMVGTAETERNYQRLKAGLEGELLLKQYLEQYGSKHWRGIQNLWMDFSGTFECDTVLLTSNQLIVFEIKNYKGLFEYNHGMSKMNDFTLSSDPVFQTRRAYTNVVKICQAFSPALKVEAALVFIGQDNEIDIQPPVTDFQVLQRHQLVHAIRKIQLGEKSRRGVNFDTQQFIEHLEKYKVGNPFRPQPICTDQMKKLRKGIYCAKCVNFNIQVSKKFVTCNCGHKELREAAVVRTILEYGTLNYDKHYTRRELFDFLGGQVSLSNLSKILANHFERAGNGKFTYHINQRAIFASNLSINE